MTNPYPIRKSPRASWFEYNEARYFITICTKDMRHYFGRIHNGVMCLSTLGEFLHQELSCPGIHHPHIEIPRFVVMPNHMHAIVYVGTQRAASADGGRRAVVSDADADDRMGTAAYNADAARRVPTLLGAYVRSLKSAVTRFAHQNAIPFEWQGRYHDHIIRGLDDLNNINSYIENNIANWETDCFYL